MIMNIKMGLMVAGDAGGEKERERRKKEKRKRKEEEREKVEEEIKDCHAS